MSQRIVREVNLLAQTLLDENGGNLERAYIDLCGRYIHAVVGYSPGFMRTAADEPKAGRIDDVPNPVSDEWIATGRQAG